MTLLALSGSCASRPSTALVVWHAYTGREQNALEQLAARYERAHPGVTVTLVAQPYGSYATKLESAIPTGNGPDLFIDAHDRIESFRAGGLLRPLRLGEERRARIAERYRDAVRHDGVPYAIPIALKCNVLYVNDALVGSPIASLEDIAGLSVGDGTVALAMESRSAYTVAALLSAYGSEPLSADGAFGWTGESAERALAHLVALERASVIEEESNADLVRRRFASGRAATAISGPWLAPDLPDELSWHVQPLPVVEAAADAPMRPFLTVESIYLGASDRARHDDEARGFAELVAFDEGARLRAEIAGQVVTDRGIEPPDDPHLQRLHRAVESARVTPIHPNMRAVFVPADRAIAKLLRGDATPREAVEEARARFARNTRPAPDPVSPAYGVLALSLAVLGLAALAFVRLRDPAFVRALRRSVPAYRYLIHAAIAVGALVVLPLIVGGAVSFFAGQRADLYFVGVSNYLDILASDGAPFRNGAFWFVLLVTVLWTVLNVALHVAIGLGLALVLHRPTLRLRGIYRVLLILPWAVPNYVTALAWKGMFHRQLGAVNAILAGFGVEPVSWFSSWATAFAANVATNVWLGFPFMMVVTLGALSAIPKEVYEAAAVDGANAWQRFTKITLPLLVPSLAPAVAMGAVWTFNMFNVVFLVSGGEPDGSTEILVSEAYRWAFTRGHQYGYAAAYAVLIFGVLLLSTRVASRLREARR